VVSRNIFIHSAFMEEVSIRLGFINSLVTSPLRVCMNVNFTDFPPRYFRQRQFEHFYFSGEGELAGKYSAKYANGEVISSTEVTVTTGENVRYVVPHKIAKAELRDSLKLYFRVNRPDKNVAIRLYADGVAVFTKNRQFANPGEIECFEADLTALDLSNVNEISIGYHSREEKMQEVG